MLGAGGDTEIWALEEPGDSLEGSGSDTTSTGGTDTLSWEMGTGAALDWGTTGGLGEDMGPDLEECREPLSTQ